MVQSSMGGKRPLGQQGKRWSRRAAAVVAVLLLIGATIYGFSGPFSAQDEDFVAQRLHAEQGDIWGPAAPKHTFGPSPKACSTRARAALEKLLTAKPLATQLVLADLESILVIDADCVVAMRILVETAAQNGQLKDARARLVERAQREPLNPAAQVGAAIFSDYAGRSGDMLAFLKRADTLRSDRLGLGATWADYLRFHNKAPKASELLSYWNRELQHGDDPRTLATLISFFSTLPDRSATLMMCDRFYKVAPHYAGAHPSRSCLKAAVEANDDTASAAYAARLQATGTSPACQQRWSTYVGFIAGQPEARQIAAETRNDCPALFTWMRGAALLAEGRNAVGQAALVSATDTPDWIRAVALGIAGQPKDGAAILTAGGRSSLLAQLLDHDLLEPVALTAVLTPPFPLTKGGQMAQAACGYLAQGLETQAQQTLAKAVSEAPNDPFVAACQLRWFVAHNDLTAADAVVVRADQLGLKHPYFIAERAHLRTVENRCAEALPLLHAARLRLPLEPTLYADLVRCLRHDGRSAEAIRWEPLTEDDHGQWTWLAVAALVLGVLVVTLLWVKRRTRMKHRG